jgi:small subunit ribosomal protein S20
MPTQRAAFKALRQAKKRTLRNLKVKTEINKLLKSARKSAVAKKIDEAGDTAKKAIKAIDRAAQKKILKKNTAARIKSRLLIYIKKNAK